MSDLIERQAAIDALFELYEYQRDVDPTEAADLVRQGIFLAEKKIEKLPSAQLEPLTDKEQRIFLSAMEREEKVCKEVDRNHIREPYEDSLMRVCKEIRRKVKSALWTR